MFGFIKKLFIVLFTTLVNASHHKNCMSLSRKNARFNLLLLIYILMDKGQELHYYLFAVKLDRCVGSCNTPNDLSNKVCVPNKTRSKRFQHDYRNK